MKTFRKCANLVAHYAKAEGKLLDVGAGAGFFLVYAQALGWEAEGVEPSRWLSDWRRKTLGVTIDDDTSSLIESDSRWRTARVQRQATCAEN